MSKGKHLPKHRISVYSPNPIAPCTVLPTEVCRVALMGPKHLKDSYPLEFKEGIGGIGGENDIVHWYVEGKVLFADTADEQVFAPSLTTEGDWVAFLPYGGSRMGEANLGGDLLVRWELLSRELGVSKDGSIQHAAFYAYCETIWKGSLVDYSLWAAVSDGDRYYQAKFTGEIKSGRPVDIINNLEKATPSLPLGEVVFDCGVSGYPGIIPVPTFLTTKTHDDFSTEYGDLIRDCISGMNLLDMNNIENLKDLIAVIKEPLEALPDIPLTVNQWKSLLRHPKKWKSTLASIHLWYRYVYKTTKSDALDALEALKNLKNYLDKLDQLYLTSRAKSYVEEEYVWAGVPIKLENKLTLKMGVNYTPDEIFDIGFWTDSLGLSINAKNLWDLVPLSFTVDWLADFQGMFANIDAWAYILNHSLGVCVYGLSRTAKMEAALLQPYVHGTLTLSYYSRKASDGLRYVPAIHAQLQDWSHIKKQWVTATALVTGRK